MDNQPASFVASGPNATGGETGLHEQATETANKVGGPRSVEDIHIDELLHIVVDRNCSDLHICTNSEPVIREGKPADALDALIEEDRDIAILVLASAVGNDGPGPLISSIASRSCRGSTFSPPGP